MSKNVLKIVVLRHGSPGLPASDYAAVLRNRLPSHEICHARTPASEATQIRDADIVTGSSISESLLADASEVKLFAYVGTGCEGLPLSAFREQNIVLTNAGGMPKPQIAESAIGSLLVLTRNLHKGWRQQSTAEWRHYRSLELTGSTVTVVGHGAIGKAVLERLDTFGVETICVRHSPEKGGAADQTVGYDADEFHDALSRTDALVLSCPLTETTRGLVGEAELSTLPQNSILVNVARGAVVETDALTSALRRNRIRGAALDVTDPEPLPQSHPIWKLENVLVTPHSAGYSPEWYRRRADLLSENTDLIRDGKLGDIENRVPL